MRLYNVQHVLVLVSISLHCLFTHWLVSGPYSCDCPYLFIFYSTTCWLNIIHSILYYSLNFVSKSVFLIYISVLFKYILLYSILVSAQVFFILYTLISFHVIVRCDRMATKWGCWCQKYIFLFQYSNPSWHLAIETLA
jgi:hypothetical protein